MLVIVAVKPLYVPVVAPPEELAELLSEPGSVGTLYEGDPKTVEDYLNSLLAGPYNLTVWDSNDATVLNVGGPVEGVAVLAITLALARSRPQPQPPRVPSPSGCGSVEARHSAEGQTRTAPGVSVEVSGGALVVWGIPQRSDTGKLHASYA